MAVLAPTFHALSGAPVALSGAPAFSASASASAGSRTRMTTDAAMMPTSRWVTRQGRQCFPRQHSFAQGPARVRVLFAHQSSPQNQEKQQPQEHPQQQEEGGSGSSQNPPQNPQQQQSGNPSATTTTGSAQDQEQQRQQNNNWASTSSPCAPWNTCASSTLYGDLLAPWFPGDRSLEQMLSTAERLMGDLMVFGPQGGRFRRGRSTTPGDTRGTNGLFSLALRRPWGVQEDDKAYTLRLDLPGLGRKDVKVRVDDTNTLFILAQKEANEMEDASSDGANMRSRSSRNFQTKLKLPDNVRKEEVSAEMKDGGLTVLLPKIPSQEPGSNGIDVVVA